MKTFKLRNGAEVAIQNIIAIGSLKGSSSMGAAIPAWASVGYEISLSNGESVSSKISWRERFFSGKPKNPLEKEQAIKLLTKERKKILKLWKK